MKEALYFSPAEFILLLELAEGGECSLLSSGEPPTEQALTLAFSTLFQRGMLRRQGAGFAPEGAGTLFEMIRNASWAVCLSNPEGEQGICYVHEERLCLVELTDAILSRQYRVRQMDRPSMERWLFDSELLERPVLSREDLSELEALEEETPEPGRQTVLLVEKRRNGGPVMELYEIYQDGIRWKVSHNGQDENYTQEALSQLLTDCFGKGNYDCRKC